MNGIMCDLSAQLKCVFICVTLELWNPKGCNFVEEYSWELLVLMKVDEEVERTWFMIARSEFWQRKQNGRSTYPLDRASLFGWSSGQTKCI